MPRLPLVRRDIDRVRERLGAWEGRFASGGRESYRIGSLHAAKLRLSPSRAYIVPWVPIRPEVSVVPTAPTFSKRFYEKFGHETVTGLAGWLNHMDLTYRTQLHELMELNFARFDAKLEQHIGQVKSELQLELAQTKADLREEIAATKATLGAEIAGTKATLREEIGQLRSEMRAGFAELENRLTGRLIRWMFVFWTGTTITLLGAMFAITRV